MEIFLSVDIICAEKWSPNHAMSKLISVREEQIHA